MRSPSAEAMIQNGITAALDKHDAFFAFSKKQYDDKAIKGVEYVPLGGGMIAPKKHAKALLEALDAAIDQGIALDEETRSKKDIIWDQLANHEAQLTYDIDDTVDALSGYSITREEVDAQFAPYMAHCVEHDLF